MVAVQVVLGQLVFDPLARLWAAFCPPIDPDRAQPHLRVVPVLLTHRRLLKINQSPDEQTGSSADADAGDEAAMQQTVEEAKGSA